MFNLLFVCARNLYILASKATMFVLFCCVFLICLLVDHNFWFACFSFCVCVCFLSYVVLCLCSVPLSLVLVFPFLASAGPCALDPLPAVESGPEPLCLHHAAVLEVNDAQPLF